MTHRSKLVTLVALAGLLLPAAPAAADPCGMVPPIWTGDGPGLERVGAQKTYVFYKDGVESIALRPGFSGKVSEFGMLIPFPSPPTIRKVPDNIFSHVACAVDPREVVLDLRRMWKMRRLSMTARLEGSGPDVDEVALNVDTVTVLNQEAVGMYEVVVLEAGSADALKRWLDEHEYKFPTGMEGVAQEYVKAGWVFVAVKTAVGVSKNVEPRPGMRDVDTSLAPGQTFDGNVQAMGFRFKTDRLVVPMRLSAYNEGKLRNIVYLLTDGPKQINNIPAEYVVRQLTGEELYRNVTGPLPVRVLKDEQPQPPGPRPLPARGDGRILPPGPGPGTPQTPEEIAAQFQALLPKRDPTDCNRYARDLFAGDLLAASTGRLEHPYEDYEKALLAIAERLKLRGEDLDETHREALDAEIARQVGSAIEGLKGMTLTVVDGDFPREVLARENLTFCDYRMPADKNNLQHYDAKIAKAPGPLQGEVVWGLIYPLPEKPAQQQTEPAQQQEEPAQQTEAPAQEEAPAVRRPLGEDVRPQRRTPRPGGIAGHLHDFTDRKAAPGAADALVEMKGRALPWVIREANSGTDLRRRGWSIVVGSEIGSSVSRQALRNLVAWESQPQIVRLWAAAGVVNTTTGTWQLTSLAKELVPDFPALGRPIVQKLLAEAPSDHKVESMLQMTIDLPELQEDLHDPILALGPAPLAKAMRTSRNDEVRRKAAGYLGTLAQQGTAGIDRAVVDGYVFNPGARRTSWEGGALFVPGLQWEKEPATELVDNLIRWMLWADINSRPEIHTQVHNNIRSVTLGRLIGYEGTWQDRTIKEWLAVWGKVVGKDALAQILAQQNATQRHQDVLDGLGQ